MLALYRVGTSPYGGFVLHWCDSFSWSWLLRKHKWTVCTDCITCIDCYYLLFAKWTFSMIVAVEFEQCRCGELNKLCRGIRGENASGLRVCSKHLLLVPFGRKPNLIEFFEAMLLSRWIRGNKRSLFCGLLFLVVFSLQKEFDKYLSYYRYQYFLCLIATSYFWYFLWNIYI